MMLDVKDIVEAPDKFQGKKVELCGWIRNHRRQKEVGFLDFFDGTCFSSLQLVYGRESEGFGELAGLKNGSAIRAEGVVLAEEGRPVELRVERAELLGGCPEDYPLQPKRHSLEYLREIAWLRPRTRVFQAVFRVRSVAAMAIHEYFQSRGYLCLHAPLLTGNDAEGAGDTFSVATETETGLSTEAFFGKHASLAVTGQLEAESFALAFKRVYSFGPSFRAENSNTRIHAAEFWQVEPEIAFCTLPELMDIEEDFLRYLVTVIPERARAELEFLEQFTGVPLKERFRSLLAKPFARVTHREAIRLLRESGTDFAFEPREGEDLAREHEKYLTETLGGPVFVYDWPKDIKAFYMYQNEDGETVGAVDLLVPEAGELMGGSRREAREERLAARMEELGMEPEGLDWYQKLRRYGCCAHSGFGMGFERFLIYLTGMENIRDVIPFCRTPGSLEF